MGQNFSAKNSRGTVADKLKGSLLKGTAVS